ncbi:MAG: ABC transporter permease subunit [Planctomycetota bacterium]
MTFSIARKEFQDTWRDGRFRWAAAIVLVLLGVAFLLARQQVEHQRTEREDATKMERDNWLNQGKKNAHAAAHYGVYVFKPVAPLSVFDRGLQPFVGNTVYLEAHRQNQAAFLPAQDATSMRRFGDLTAAACLQLLVPLLIILLAFGTLAGERESGTLRQVLSLGVRPASLVFGKALGLGGALALLLLLPAAVGGIYALSGISGVDAAGEESVLRLCLMACTYLLYLGAILVICITVSALAPTSRSALSILLVFWVANAVLAPRLASDLAQGLLPTPKMADLDADLLEARKQALNSHNPNSEAMKEFIEKNRDASGKLPGNFRVLLMQESERQTNLVYEKHFGRIWDLMEAQDKVVTWAGLAAPLLGLRSASVALAGTDFTHHRHFSVAAEDHRREFIRMLNNSQGASGRELWEKLPPFRYQPPPLSHAVSAAMPGLIVLCLWLAAGCAALYFASRRLNPS